MEARAKVLLNAIPEITDSKKDKLRAVLKLHGKPFPKYPTSGNKIAMKARSPMPTIIPLTGSIICPRMARIKDERSMAKLIAF